MSPGALRQPFGWRGRGGMGRDAEPRRAGISRDRGADLRNRRDHPRGRRRRSPSSRSSAIRRSSSPSRDAGIDIYHVNDFLISKGWRLNALQLPAGSALLRDPPEHRTRRRRGVRRRPARGRRVCEDAGTGPGEERRALRARWLARGQRGARHAVRAPHSTRCTRWSPEAMTEPWILAVDLGTGGPEDRSGEPRRRAARRRASRRRHDVHRRRRRRAGPRSLVARASARASPRCWHPALPAMRGRAWGSPGSGARRCRSVSAVTAVGPCRLWSDTRGGRSRRATGRPDQHRGVFAGQPRCVVAPDRGRTVSQAAPTRSVTTSTCASSSPSCTRARETLLEPLDYLGMRFTGRRAATQASMILSWLTDNRPKRAARVRPRARAPVRSRRVAASRDRADRQRARRDPGRRSPRSSDCRRASPWLRASRTCTPATSVRARSRRTRAT